MSQSKSIHDPKPEGDALTRIRRTQGRVLVIDDEGLPRNEAVIALKEEGFEVAVSLCCEDALEIARSLLPDAVVVDVCRPECETLDLCGRLKAQATGLLPVLHLSAAGASDQARSAGISFGADGYLAHPFDPSELRAAVSALMRIRHQDSERVAGDAVNSILRSALDALSENVALLGPEGDIVAVNRSWSDFADANGYPAGAGLGLDYCGVCEKAQGVGPDEAQLVAAGLKKILAGESESFEIDYAFNSATEERWFRLGIRRVAQSGPVAAIVTHVDRSHEVLASKAEHTARRAQHESDARFRRYIEIAHDGVLATDVVGRITYANPRLLHLLGYKAHELSGKSIFEVMPDVESFEARNRFAHQQRGNSEVVESRLQRRDGSPISILIASSPIIDADASFIGTLAVISDITERKTAEVQMAQALQERENLLASLEAERLRLAAIFQEAPAFLAVLRGPNHVFERVNPAYLELVGHRDSIGKAVLEALPELRGQGFVEILDQVRSTGEPFIARQMPVQLVRTEGEGMETRYVDQVYQRLNDADGDYSILVHGVDVTDHVLATEALRLTEQRLRNQFAKLPVPTFLWEDTGDEFVLIDRNEAAVRALEPYGGSEIGRTSRQLFPGMQGLEDDVRQCLVDNVVMRRSVEIDFGPPAGRRTFDLTIGPQPPNRLLLHSIDTTDRSELESQLRQAQKMEAVGRLAGGVAHDFNNILTVIGAHSSFLLESLDPGDARREDAQEIHKAGVRATGLTRQLLAFGRKQLLKPRALDLNAIIVDTRMLLTRLLGEDIEIVTLLAADLGRVVADSSQIDQVLMNLALNARDAMPDGGRLTISARNAAVDSELHGADSAIPRGEYVLLEVSDTGTGMDEETQARLFEPFFTTKELGKGTGLGLSTVYGIVKQSGGYIQIDSTVGHGSRFCIYLPVVAPSPPATNVRAAENAANRGVETVLVVEDEPAVREIAKRILTRQGYVVLEASNGNAALQVSAAFTATIHLVLSDAVMPGISGAETVRRLKLQRPDLKVLFMSGYTDDEVVRRGIVSSAVPFIQKPFAPAGLAAAVREALDADQHTTGRF
jgi:two-component system cell cycle sensor histidine kinase/response regulator CckA